MCTEAEAPRRRPGQDRAVGTMLTVLPRPERRIPMKRIPKMMALMLVFAAGIGAGHFARRGTSRGGGPAAPPIRIPDGRVGREVVRTYLDWVGREVVRTYLDWSRPPTRAPSVSRATPGAPIPTRSDSREPRLAAARPAGSDYRLVDVPPAAALRAARSRSA